MFRTVPIASNVTQAECEALLRGIEARVGEITDLVATTDDPEEGKEPEKETLVTANRFKRVTVNSLRLVAEGEDPPDGTELIVAGTAWISDKQTVVKVYR